ncbi:hypothetical protein CRE_23171 [Caenorhabditis remanei]|uniref:Uncharacterized protein n=1 Tax=Caenorhabditis remanei TaxID=31234 RepID=E3NJ46_CAERE|nr:hypothetical protein CRE_23171 [Caenorhabditis remanei]
MKIPWDQIRKYGGNYRALYDHVLKLTRQVNELQACLMETCSTKVSERLSSACPMAQDPPAIGEPVFCHSNNDVFSFSSSNGDECRPTSYAEISSKNLPKQLSTLSIAQEAAKMLDKATRAVIERFPDSKDDPEQEKRDLEFFSTFSAKHGLPSPSQAHRHPSKTACRPLKLQFASNSERDKFLNGFFKAKNADPSLSSIQSRPRARRDLTREELKRLYESRKFVYDNNLKEKSSKFIMVDIEYKLNKNPRPFL